MRIDKKVTNQNIILGKKVSVWYVIKKSIAKDKYLWLLVLFPLIYYAVFCYGPMYGLIIAFENYSPYKGMLAGPWVGFKWFIQFFESAYVWQLIKNTLLINVYSIVFAFPPPIILALLLNEITKQWFKRTAQTISYLPHFISTVVVVGMAVNFLSPSTGIINDFIRLFGGEPIYFMADPKWFRTIYIATGIWQEVGWSSIIYLAALSGVDYELYEAAKVDGASKMRQVWHITIPGILPTIIIMLILSMGHMFSVGADKILLLYNPVTYDTADVINTYVYRTGIGSSEFSFGTAVGLFQSVVNFVLIIIVNKVSKKINDVSLW